MSILLEIITTYWLLSFVIPTDCNSCMQLILRFSLTNLHKFNLYRSLFYYINHIRDFHSNACMVRGFNNNSFYSWQPSCTNIISIISILFKLLAHLWCGTLSDTSQNEKMNNCLSHCAPVGWCRTFVNIHSTLQNISGMQSREANEALLQ